MLRYQRLNQATAYLTPSFGSHPFIGGCRFNKRLTIVCRALVPFRLDAAQRRETLDSGKEPSADETLKRLKAKASSNTSGDLTGSEGSKKDAGSSMGAGPSNGETLEALSYECRPSPGVT